MTLRIIPASKDGNRNCFCPFKRVAFRKQETRRRAGGGSLLSFIRASGNANKQSNRRCPMTNPAAEQDALAKILCDREMRKLLRKVILDPYPKVMTQKIIPLCEWMAIVTRTTMMREGIRQSAIKVDSGCSETLNGGLRNSSIGDFVLDYGKPIFKLTFFCVRGDETADIPSGDSADDRNQNVEGIVRSNRRVPARPPKGKPVGRSLWCALIPKTTLRSRIPIRPHWPRTDGTLGEMGRGLE
jgi:hypothetical protein